MWFDYSVNIILPVNAIPRESIHDKYMIYYFAQSFTRWSTYMLGGAFAGMLIIYKDGLDGSFAKNPISIAELDKEEVYANCESNLPALSVPSFLNTDNNEVEAKMTPITSYSWVREVADRFILDPPRHNSLFALSIVCPPSQHRRIFTRGRVVDTPGDGGGNPGGHVVVSPGDGGVIAGGFVEVSPGDGGVIAGSLIIVAPCHGAVSIRDFIIITRNDAPKGSVLVLVPDD